MHLTNKPILPAATIGIFDNGQLERMIALAALPMGYKVITYGPSADGCAINVACGSTVGSYEDKKGVANFLKNCDVVTLAFENIPASVFDVANDLGKTIYPGREALRVSQNRSEEKKLAQELGFRTVDYWVINSELSLIQPEITFPLILKTCRGGYDGKNQKRVNNREELAKAWNELGCVDCVAEAVVDFETELSVIVARSANGEMRTFEPFENLHEHGILSRTQWPWRNRQTEKRYIRAADDAQHYAWKIAEKLEVVGLLAVELFLTRGGEVLFNEIAPRPHNTGHITIDCGRTSQFEQHVRAICGLPLGDPSHHTNGTMYNLIGSYELEEKFVGNPEAKIHRYGKQPRPGRKIGHITVLKDTTPLSKSFPKE